METKKDIKRLFAPKSIAIVGASDKPGKVGTVIAQNISQLGFKGKIFYVNQANQELYGQKCYAALSDIEESVDLAIIAVPAQFVVDVVRNAADKIKNYVVISAGFSEIGEEGKSREEELHSMADEKGLNILGPNCLGFIVPGLKLNASFAGGMPETGNISFVSQSGALAVAMMDIAKKENLRFSSIISVGNKMQLSEIDLLDYLVQDKNTKVIGMYLEGIKEGIGFIEAAQFVSSTKPIVVLKAGKTDKSQKAISSHTGALAGSDEIFSVACKKAGVIRANDLDEFFSLLKLFSSVDSPKNEKVAVLTNAGGAGVLTSDAFKGKVVKLADISADTKEKLRAILPAESSVENPIDVLGDAKEDRYGKALQSLEDEDLGTIICVLTPQQQTPVEAIADEIIEYAKKTNKTIVTLFIGGERIESSVLKLQAAGVPNFSYPEQTVNALASYFQWKNSAHFAPGSFEMDDDRRGKIGEMIKEAKEARKKALLYTQAVKVMKSYGIKSVPCIVLGNAKEIPEDMEYPVVVKVDSDTVLHKTDKQGLILGIKDREGLAAAIAKLQDNFPGEQIIAQPMRNKFAEIILGIKRDSIFGPVVVYGLGGIYTEVFKMVDFIIPPMTVEQIIANIKESKVAFLFESVRGQKPCDIESFAQTLEALGRFALENENFAEFDINPLFIYNDDREPIAVDIKIIF